MTSAHKIIIVILAALSAACELFGTWAVWNAYQTSVNIGNSIRAAISTGRSIDDAVWSDPNERLALQIRGKVDPGEFQRLKNDYHDTLETLAQPLKKSTLASAGLAAYVAGAILGLAAAIVAVS